MTTPRRRTYVRVVYLPRRCAGCGEPFTPRKIDSWVCSNRCRMLARDAEVRAAALAARPFRACASCGADITARRSDAETCSPLCLGRIRRARSRDALAAHQRTRDAVQRAAVLGYGVPLHEWQRIVRRARGRCYYCDVRAPLTMDHVVPLARGGRHCIGNVVAACGPCNASKNDRFLVEWMRAS